MPDTYLTTKELETKYSVSKSTIAKWREAGMPFYKVSGIYRYIEQEVDQWFKNQNNKGKND